jgi:hypothetical protein
MSKSDPSGIPASSSGDQAAAVAAKAASAAQNVVMDLGTSVIIKGELSASEDLTLYGQMEGSVTLSNHTLTYWSSRQHSGEDFREVHCHHGCGDG